MGHGTFKSPSSAALWSHVGTSSLHFRRHSFSARLFPPLSQSAVVCVSLAQSIKESIRSCGGVVKIRRLDRIKPATTFRERERERESQIRLTFCSTRARFFHSSHVKFELNSSFLNSGGYCRKRGLPRRAKTDSQLANRSSGNPIR